MLRGLHYRTPPSPGGTLGGVYLWNRGKASRTSCCSTPALTRADQGAEAAGAQESIWPEASRAQSARAVFGLSVAAPSSFRGKQEVIKSKLSPGQVSAQPQSPPGFGFPGRPGHVSPHRAGGAGARFHTYPRPRPRLLDSFHSPCNRLL